MKTSAQQALLTFAITLLASGVCRGGPLEEAILAAMKLSEKPNYSWTSTVMDDARAYNIEGKTKVKADWTWVRLPMVKKIAQRLGHDAGPELEAVFKGNTAAVIRTSDGWQTFSELPWWEPVVEDDWPDSLTVSPTDPFLSNPLVMLPAPTAPPDRPKREEPYSNAQFAVSRPHEELAVIVSSYADMNVEGDTVTGTLTDTGAALLLVRDGQEVVPLAAGGKFTLRLKDGIVSSYLLQLEGMLDIGRKKNILVRQTSNTVIKNIGTTAFDVPREARQKLGP